MKTNRWKAWGFALAGLAVLMLMGLVFSPHAAAGALLIAPVPLLLDRPIKEVKKDLAKLLGELGEVQKKMTDGKLSQAEGEAAEQKAEEAEELQAYVDRYERIGGLAAKGREIDGEPALPAGKADPVHPDAQVVGYLSLGRAFAQSAELKQFLTQGMPQQGSLPFAGKGFRGRDRFIALTRKGLAALEERLGTKAIATIGADVIEPQRIAEVVRDEEMEILNMRSLLNVQGTNSNSVEYMTMTPAAAPAAAPVAESGLKPETSFALDTATAPVRTLAVHMPVTEQQLQDLPQVEGIIDSELRYEVAFVEDEQLAWGDGTGQNLLGIFNTPGVLAGRTVSGDTLIDKIRRAITDVRVSRNVPNGLAVHPYDWEAIQLLKGTDERYVWVVVTDPATGQMRIWGLTVVESLGMEEPSAATTPERRILVGDFVRGATLWDRQSVAVAVGWVNDQFIRNQRTIRAEERLAFGVKRPQAFRYIIAAAEVA